LSVYPGHWRHGRLENAISQYLNSQYLNGFCVAAQSGGLPLQNLRATDNWLEACDFARQSLMRTDYEKGARDQPGTDLPY
jgi:hypothetical protein